MGSLVETSFLRPEVIYPNVTTEKAAASLPGRRCGGRVVRRRQEGGELA